jgi:trehalose transport system substrate-binding protein
MPAWMGSAMAGGLAAAFLVGSAGCQPPDAERAPGGPLADVALTFAISLAEDEKDAVREVLDRFTRETGASVAVAAVTGEDLPEKLKVEVRAGRPTIDLFAKDTLALRVLVDEGLVEDLSEMAIPEGVLPAMVPERFEGKQYFLPFRPNVQVTYVNRNRFTQAAVTPPTTVEELRTVARALKSAARGVPKVTLPLAQGGAAGVTITEWIVAFGGNPLLLNDAGSVRAFEFLRSLWAEGLLARESLLAKYDTQVDYLQGETAWLAPNWPFTSKVFAEQDILKRFEVYAGWRGPVRAAHVLGGDVLGIPKGIGGRRREGALALARFLMSRGAQQVLVERNAWPSIRNDAYGGVPAEQRETFDAIQQALANAVRRPDVAYWADVTEAMNEAVRRILVRGEPLAAVLDALHAQIEAAARRMGAPYPPTERRWLDGPGPSPGAAQRSTAWR